MIHTHSLEATSWDYSTGWYGDYVNQLAVDLMTDRGVTALTNTATVVDAWHAIMPSYQAGQKVAIKVNLNNAGCGDDDQVIDALPQPVNSVIRGLKTIGVAESDIWIYDVTDGWHSGEFPDRLITAITARYPGVQFHALENWCSSAVQTLGFSGSQHIHFNVPSGKPAITDQPICNALVNAHYLINMPIMKKHGMAGVTLGFKNHFGSFQTCQDAHWSVELGDGNYVSTYNGMIDIFNNSHVKDKTVLTVGDALYGARFNNYSEVPNPWPTFNNKSPNSLFFALDPVAIDCVMYDFLDDEGGVPAQSDDYLKLAATAGLGVFEHWDAQHHYSTILYERHEVVTSAVLTEHTYVPLIVR